MSQDLNTQTMKPLTAAAKLGIFLPAAPEEFRSQPITRGDLEALRQNPPQWLSDLWTAGPFPRDVVARKLGVTNTALARNDVSDSMTQAEIDALSAEEPDWLKAERENYAEVQREAVRVKEKEEARRAQTNRPPKNR
ncbi:hypothetical protein HQ325_12830 [Rhodococcus sp. BP-349]|uniref:DUF5997 family protein n=1 Tax=unclassified Rhodococcus (in: high G+C Gram-positive bacteria) TaxID=192944 RepID=UPI001D595B72|nr:MULTISPECIES: DUF5997 family protein [unclassified Rhodococcus (in: high G+C Gram-positive bacteria)]MBY6539559.1 hypothetical protein [Rhodococcus sp. BP-363]MBY6544113.1 hypothetical protein [Rhodococcus sp. BP-369]MBY6563343.1 hypothetical protein [Rhodococcus sp. BP-370]MBY6577635.1 hypothetical protein [Rhodococcus sp. BP-364]MBY6586936.1 hypothetical protein [Rhodococcus sp. BP-358]